MRFPEIQFGAGIACAESGPRHLPGMTFAVFRVKTSKYFSRGHVHFTPNCI
jgi:hypothetical protein